MLPTNLQNYHPPPPQPLPQGRRGVHHPPPPQSLPQGGRGGTHEAGNNWDNAAYSLQNVFQKERNLDFVHLGVCSYKAYQLACELCACVCVCVSAHGEHAFQLQWHCLAKVAYARSSCFFKPLAFLEDRNWITQMRTNWAPATQLVNTVRLRLFWVTHLHHFCSSQHVPLAKQTLAASVLSWPAHCVR